MSRPSFPASTALMCNGRSPSSPHRVRQVSRPSRSCPTASSIRSTAIPPLIGIALLLSACAEGADYRGGYGYPAYSSFYGGGWEGWHHGWDHGHWDGHRDFGHEGHGGWGHGFSGHAGFGGRGGGGGH